MTTPIGYRKGTKVFEEPPKNKPVPEGHKHFKVSNGTWILAESQEAADNMAKLLNEKRDVTYAALRTKREFKPLVELPKFLSS